MRFHLKLKRFWMPQQNKFFKNYDRLSQFANSEERVFVAFDTETTGLSSERDRVIEIGAVKFTVDREIERFSALINPEMPIPKAASSVNHITDFMVKDCPKIKEILPSFTKFIDGAVLIAHNASFDLNFMNAELERNGFSRLSNTSIDTLQLSRWAFPHFAQHKLQFLAEKLNITVTEAHRATDDAFVCMQLFLRILTEKAHPERAFRELYEIVAKLRAKNGCPWDKNQTPLSIRRDLMEETFEAIDAITKNDVPHVREELGDVMLNAVMLSYMFEQENAFTVEQVLYDVCKKLVRRHPHVFPDSAGKSQMQEKPANSDAVLSQWDKIKENVEGRNGNTLDEVPEYFPPLLKAYKMLKKASKKGFEWQNTDEFIAKVREEWAEAEEARQAVQACSEGGEAFTVSGGSAELNEAQLHLEEEIGDLFLSLVNYSRALGVDPSIALDRANRKFKERFSFVEDAMHNADVPMSKEHISAMLEFWRKAK